MSEEVKVSKLEKIMINTCSPLLYMMTHKESSFKDIIQQKEYAYKRIVKYADRGEIPDSVLQQYQNTLCGKIAVTTSKLRKYIK